MPLWLSGRLKLVYVNAPYLPPVALMRLPLAS